MMGFISAAYFLINLFFTIILFVLWMRLLLRYFRISVLHPVSQVIDTLTNPIVNPINQLIYGNTTPKQYEWVTLSYIVLVEIIKFICLSLIAYRALMPLPLLGLFVVADLIVQPCNLFFYLIIIRVIMSWVNPQWNHPVAGIINTLTNPLLRLGRKIIPNISGFDFSPFIIVIGLKIITLFISASMPLPML